MVLGKLFSKLFPAKFYIVYHYQKDHSVKKHYFKKKEILMLDKIERLPTVQRAWYEGRVQVLTFYHDERLPVDTNIQWIPARNIQLEEQFFQLKLSKMLKGETALGDFVAKYGMWIALIAVVIIGIYLWQNGQTTAPLK